MSKFNTATNYPLIPNAQQYMFEKQYVSIHSEDRNVLKFPNSSEFEIELPQDYLNVQGVKMVTSRFPSNLNVFSYALKNVTVTFRITEPYNPANYEWPYDGSYPVILDNIFAALYYNQQQDFVVVIEEGNYTPQQMVTQLNNQFNLLVTNLIANSSYLSSEEQATFLAEGGYNEFVVVYNEVSKKFWFGNKSSGFVLTNSVVVYLEQYSFQCSGVSPLVTGNYQLRLDSSGVNINYMNCQAVNTSNYMPWGLPWYLGLPRCDSVAEIDLSGNTRNSATRFFYTDVSNGIWLVPSGYPNYFGASAYYVEATYQANLTPPLYFYVELKGLNFLDETEPYNFTSFTMQTNQTNGIVKSAFAKIPILTNCEQQWYESTDGHKIYNPPAERIRRIYVKIRYHDGTLVNFGSSEFSFMLEFSLFRPQNAKTYFMYTPESIANGNN
jgi:hypothetical protein